MLKYLWFAFLCCLTVSCGGGTQKTTYRIGVDSTWYPLLLDGKESSLTAFSTELLQEIAKQEKIALTKVSVSWDLLMEGLKKGEYSGILFSMPPYNFNQQTYDFSDLYLKTGPVLVVPAAFPFTSFENLSGKEIAVTPDSPGTLILEKYPRILIRNYDSIAKALSDVSTGVIDGAIVDVLPAVSYCQDLYLGKLKIVTEPLNDSGLRLITLHNRAPQLIEAFNEGLEKLMASKEYDRLLMKWGFSSLEAP
jgi:polar amino acid transport system substrate-binding protein